MRPSIRSRLIALVRAQWAGLLALFLVIAGGTAYAANTVGSADIINGEVKTQDIGDSEVRAADVAPDSLGSAKIADRSVKNADLSLGASSSNTIADNGVRSVDVFDNTLTAADLGTGSVGTNEIADQTVTGTDLAGTGEGDNGFSGDEEIIDATISGFDIGNDQIGANHIIDGSLTAGDTSDVFDAGYGSDAACNDDDGNGEVCASTTFTVHQPGNLLVNATGEWRTASSGGDGVEMICVLQVDGADIGVAQSIGEAGTNHPAAQNGTMALTALSDQLGVGEHTVQTLCSQLNADIDLGDNQITAARVDG